MIKNLLSSLFLRNAIDKTNIKGRLVSIDENVMILQNRNGNQTINENEIYDVKVRKFSILKLATGIVGTYGAFVVIGVLALASFAL